jgi:LytR cell envelope-related transcriptional attenuator
MAFVLAFSLQDQVEKWGAYAGIAAFLGLAVLSLLYFAQAREVKRLRDWAGRAPERAQELEARVVAQAEEARRIAAAPAAQPTAVVAAAAASGNGHQTGPIPGPRPAVAAAQVAAPAGPLMGPRPAVAAALIAASLDGQRVAPAAEREPAAVASAVAAPGEAATDAPPAGAAAPGASASAPAAPPAERAPAEGAPAERAPAEGAPAGPAAERAPVAPPPPAAAPPGGPPPRPGSPSSAIPRATPRQQPGAPARVPPSPPRPAAAPLRAAPRTATVPPRRGQPAREASGARIAVLTVLGVLVLGAGGFAAMQILGNDDEPAPPPNQTTDPTASARGAGERAVAARPETVVVVLNGTLVDGLASRTRDELVAEGYSEEEGMIRTGDNTDQQRQDSVVLYVEGQRRQARDVASILDIDNLEPIDQDTLALANLTDETGRGLTPEVTVILGADQAP